MVSSQEPVSVQVDANWHVITPERTYINKPLALDKVVRNDSPYARWISINMEFTTEKFHTKPVSPRICQENIPGSTSTYLEKNTAIYASIHVQTNQIYIIVSTEVTPYLSKSTSTICAPRVVLSNEISQVTVPGTIPRNMPQGEKTTPMCKLLMTK